MYLDSTPVGRVVSQTYRSGASYICTRGGASGWEEVRDLGVNITTPAGMKLVAGVTADSFHSDFGGAVYTVPQLELLGLGVVFYEYHIVRKRTCSHPDTPSVDFEHVFSDNPLTAGKHLVGDICPSGYELTAWWGDRIGGYVEFALVKIGVPDTGTGVNKSFLFSLMSFQMIDYWSAVGGAINIGGIFNFDSRATTCATPTASESIINFGMLTQQQVQATAVGDVIATRDFVMNFSCSKTSSHKAVSFFVDPVYGKADGVYGNSGVMNIAPGVGMATQGAGYSPLHVTVPSEPYQQPPRAAGNLTLRD